MKKEISTSTAVFSILGTLIGAGFASGAEIITFFCKFGWFGIAFSFLFFVLTFCGIFFLLKLGKKYGSCDNANKKIFGKWSFFPKAVFDISYFVVFANMLAGSRLIVNNIFANIFIIAITFCALAFGFSTIVKINGILLPLLLAFLIFAPIVFLCNNKISLPQPNSVVLSGANAILYSSTNLAISTALIMSLGSRLPTKKHLGIAIWTMIVLIPIFLLLTLALCGVDNSSSKIPTLALVSKPQIAFVAKLCLVIATTTTMLSCGYPLVERTKQLTHNQFVATTLLMVPAVFMSNFGFASIITYLYPSLGVLGLIYLVLMAILDFLQTKKSVKHAL